MSKYELINPYIVGDMATIYKGQTPLKAANKAWSKLSSYFNNDVPQFSFTLKNIEGGSLFHFNVNEKNSNGNVDYELTEFKISKKDEDIIKQKVGHLKDGNYKVLKGGRRDADSSSSSSSSSSSEYTNFNNGPCNIFPFYNCLNKTIYNTPIFYWWYAPIAYKSDSCFIPTFHSYITPYLELQTTNWYLF